jgi:hypothetical protein
MALLISKEEISSYKIVPALVNRVAKWHRELSYAMRLGNEFKGKTNITFETTEGPVSVETTVWSVAGGHLQLKGGTMIPVDSIVDIHF